MKDVNEGLEQAIKRPGFTADQKNLLTRALDEIKKLKEDVRKEKERLGE